MFKHSNKIVRLSLCTTLLLTSNAFPQSFSGLNQSPLLNNNSSPPLFLLTMQRDARLFVEAYDDGSDINGDGIMDMKYNPALQQYKNVCDSNSVCVATPQFDSDNKPVIVDYYGYFDSYKCYEYKTFSYKNTTTGGTDSVKAFVPIGDTDTGTKKCTSIGTDSTGLTKPWSGDFLNYMTTTRIDALRKVWYGGKRFVDFSYDSANDTAATVLERANIPQDLHAFGKEYNSEAIDGYKIFEYTPLSSPGSGRRHLFANVTLGAAPNTTALKNKTYNPPLLRILQNQTAHAWDWIAAETSAVADTPLNGVAVTPTDLNVRVVVCDTDNLPKQGIDNPDYCEKYGSNNQYKPIGLLHKYGESNKAYFGLLTGSYNANNFSGGVLRKAISSFTNEVDAATGRFTGQFYDDTATSVKGITYTMDRLQVLGFSFSGAANFGSTTGSGSSSYTVGNPVAEMMYEGLRYLAGNTTPTSNYIAGLTVDTTTKLSNESPQLPALKTWTNPYGGSGFNQCAKPTQMVLSDINPTFDSDELPGNAFATFTASSLGSGTNALNVSTLANSIWTSEGLGTRDLIIGEKLSGSETGLPTLKSGISGFSTIRGLVPEDPKWQGSYYAGAVAKFGKETDLKTLGNSGISSISTRTVDTTAVALASALPRIQIPLGTQTVTVVPFAQTNAGNDSSWNIGDYMKVYVDNVRNVPGMPSDTATDNVNKGAPYYKMHVVFSDTSLYTNKGTDNDMDARATYEVYVNPDTNKIVVNVCADPDPIGKNSTLTPTITSVDETARCNKDGVEGIGYSATGSGVMHLGYFISGVIIPSGEKATRLVVRNPAYSGGGRPTGGNIQEYVNPLDLPGARLSGTFIDNYYNAATQNLTDLVTYRTAASDSKSLRLNHSASYDISATAAANFVPHDPLWYAAKYGGYQDENNNLALDGNEWVSTDGVTPWGYYLVTNPANLKAQIDAAVNLRLNAAASSFSAAASNSTKLQSGDAIFQATFKKFDATDTTGKTIYWSGDLTAYQLILKSNGTTDTSTKLWSAAAQLPAYASRKIFTYRASPSSGIPFTWASLNATEQGKVGSSGLLDYIRGSRANEGTTTGKYRKRDPNSLLGDIIDSAPVYAGGTNLGYSALSGDAGTSYDNWVTTSKSKRTKMVYVGANDGMLHGFNATTGAEQFAYIPRANLLADNGAAGLSTLSSLTYTHHFFVDGAIVVDDFYDENKTTPSASTWKSVLVGTMGAGGRAIFALDVSTPDTFTTSSVMWEFSHPELGFVRNPPVVARLNDGNWYVIVGNGFESDTCDNTKTPRYKATAVPPSCTTQLAFTDRNAKLFVIKLKPDLSDGWTQGSDYFIIHATDLQVTTIPPSMSGTPVTYDNGTDNGLSGPSIPGNTSKGGVSWIFAGDLQGNIWKFDLSSTTPSDWATKYKLLQAANGDGDFQPITSPLAVAAHPSKSDTMCVSAGTGRFVYTGDLTNNSVQSVYGVMDNGTAPITITRSSQLQQYTVTAKKTETIGSNTWNTVYVSNETFDTNKRGWFVDLREPTGTNPRDIGERIIQAPTLTKLRTNELLASFVTSIPAGDTCESDGTSFALDFNACTGEALSNPTFDLNGDAIFNSSDLGSPDSNSRMSGVQVGGGVKTDGSASSPALCFASKDSSIPGCTFDLSVLSCTDGTIKTFKKPPSLTSCGVSRTSWRQLR